MNIALFGGRFDPPHVGHAAIAQYILSADLGIDQVWLLPAHTHPWRPIVASDADRLAMVRFLENKNILVKDIELVRGETTRTIDTIRQLKRELPEHTYFWICGVDQVADLAKWDNNDELQESLTFLIIPRKGFNQHIDLPKKYIFISEKYSITDLSSSEIRDKIHKGLSIKGLVPEKVEKYIGEKGLYVSN